jgi:hypothetical protein
VRWRARTIVPLHSALRAGRPQLKRDPLGSTAMNPDTHPPVPILPSPRRLHFAALSPVLGGVAATLVARVNVLTAVAAFVGAVAVMIRARTFILSFHTSQDRSLLRGTFGMMFDRLPPPPLQHWYVPLITGAFAAAAAELLRATFALRSARVPMTIQLLVGPAAFGLLEGAFLIFTAVATWALVASLLLRPRRPGRAA